MERRSSSIAASSAKSHQTLLILQSSSFGFNSSSTMRLQPVLVAACFLAAFCYFFLLSFFPFFFPFSPEFVNCKVKLKSNFTISVMKCKQMWLFHVTLCLPCCAGVCGGVCTLDHVLSLTAQWCQFPCLDPRVGDILAVAHPREIALNLSTYVHIAAVCLALGMTAGRRVMGGDGVFLHNTSESFLNDIRLQPVSSGSTTFCRSIHLLSVSLNGLQMIMPNIQDLLLSWPLGIQIKAQRTYRGQDVFGREDSPCSAHSGSGALSAFHS